jgi:hypothetical protein
MHQVICEKSTYLPIYLPTYRYDDCITRIAVETLGLTSAPRTHDDGERSTSEEVPVKEVPLPVTYLKPWRDMHVESAN